MSRTVTSRSGGAIEGPELPPPCPRYVRRAATVTDAPGGFAVLAVTVVVTFAATA